MECGGLASIDEAMLDGDEIHMYRKERRHGRKDRHELDVAIRKEPAE